MLSVLRPIGQAGRQAGGSRARIPFLALLPGRVWHRVSTGAKIHRLGQLSREQVVTNTGDALRAVYSSIETDVVLGAKISLNKLEFAWRDAETEGRGEDMRRGNIYTTVDDQNNQIPDHTGKKEELRFSHNWDKSCKQGPKLIEIPGSQGSHHVLFCFVSFCPSSWDCREATCSSALGKGPRVCCTVYLQAPRNWLPKAKAKISTHFFLSHHQTRK